eukprot:TRINITY_DN7566_c0_g1_i1.p1 TRINITY_DN7566_c0_g1~~TRINITY_DN7566_c0_g1_i1.p1  ORF type:complete len:148 (-),score=14.09 TRINITY_DN7566_c0_g1_i1:74-517(-)
MEGRYDRRETGRPRSWWREHWVVFVPMAIFGFVLLISMSGSKQDRDAAVELATFDGEAMAATLTNPSEQDSTLQNGDKHPLAPSPTQSQQVLDTETNGEDDSDEVYNGIEDEDDADFEETSPEPTYTPTPQPSPTKITKPSATVGST